MTALMVPETHYLRTPDGAYIAWQATGDGPVDVAFMFHATQSNVDLMWDEPDWRPFLVGTAALARLILHDRRGLGVSSRNVPPPNLETQAADLLAVLDAAESKRAILVGNGITMGPLILFAAQYPERVQGLIWLQPMARAAWAPDYPWGESDAEHVADLEKATTHWGSTAHGREIADWRSRERLGIDPAAPVDDAQAREINTYARTIRNTASPDVAAEIIRILHETDVRALLPLVQAPAHLLVGTLDPVDETRSIAALLPHATVHMVEGRAGAYDPLERVLRSMTGSEPAAPTHTVLAAVLFTDLVGSTSRHAAMGDRAWTALLAQHHELVRDSLRRWRGVEQDTAGDGFFATFDGPARAIRCAREIIDDVRELGLEIRAGIHVGECEVLDGKLTGLTVTIGARISAAAGSAQLLVSQTVRDLVAGSGFHYDDAGEHTLKGVPGTWRLSAVGIPAG
jgi:class 3 adenylate cyclase/pimeloyl-ACP methyl ester carboxylesterase